MVEQVEGTGGVAPEKEREGARRATGIPFSGTGAKVPEPADPEVSERASRRKFTVQYKLGFPGEADRCEARGIGALLRREGLYSSHLST